MLYDVEGNVRYLLGFLLLCGVFSSCNDGAKAPTKVVECEKEKVIAFIAPEEGKCYLYEFTSVLKYNSSYRARMGLRLRFDVFNSVTTVDGVDVLITGKNITYLQAGDTIYMEEVACPKNVKEYKKLVQ